MISAVLDATVAIGLARGEVSHHLPPLFSPLYVTPGVIWEVVNQGLNRSGTAEMAHALGNWLTEAAPSPAAMLPFGGIPSAADRELLALAVEQRVDLVLSDDRVVRREARAQGITSITTPQIVVLKKEQGLIPLVRPILDRMRLRGFGIADQDYQDALTDAGE